MADYTPTPQAVEAFKAAWHEADAEGDAVEKAARAWHEAAEAMDDEGPQMGPWDDLDPHDRDRARRYMRAALDAAGVGALRAEVERLRAVSAAQPYETERELAVALDDARQQVADLRAGIESVQKAIENNRGIDRAWDALNALLAGSGEQPGEVTHACPGDEGLTPCCGRTPFELPSTDRMTLDAELVTCHCPATVAPDSTDVLREAEAALIRATKGDDPTAWAGTGWWHVHRLLAAVGPRGQEGS